MIKNILDSKNLILFGFILKVLIGTKDKKKTQKSVNALMGKKPELRFKFITENSNKVLAENIL